MYLIVQKGFKNKSSKNVGGNPWGGEGNVICLKWVTKECMWGSLGWENLGIKVSLQYESAILCLYKEASTIFICLSCLGTQILN